MDLDWDTLMRSDPGTGAEMLVGVTGEMGAALATHPEIAVIK